MAKRMLDGMIRTEALSAQGGAPTIIRGDASSRPSRLRQCDLLDGQDPGSRAWPWPEGSRARVRCSPSPVTATPAA
jgi:hypothetical protein